MMDVEHLSDSELASALKERGVDIGPIVESTRRVYEKKLVRLLDQEVGAEGVTTSQEVEEEYYEEEFDPNSDTQPVEEVVAPTYRQTRSSPVRPRSTAQSEPPTQVQRGSPMRSAARYELGDVTESSRYESSETTLTRRSLRPTGPTVTGRAAIRPTVNTAQSKPPAKRGLPIWVQVLIFLAVAVLIFLVIQNMEPAAKDPLKIEN